MEREKMEHSIITKRAALLIGLLFGLPIGCLVSLCIVGMVQQPIENPRVMSFGDLSILATIQKDPNDEFVEELWLTKNDRPFLFARRNKLDEVKRLILTNGKSDVILTLRASSSPGRWYSAMYGPSNLVGELYQDIDFDGQFDIRKKIDSNGNVQSNHIYYEENWKKFDVFQEQKVISGNDTFTFQKGSGWQLEKVEKDADNQKTKKLPKIDR